MGGEHIAIYTMSHVCRHRAQSDGQLPKNQYEFKFIQQIRPLINQIKGPLCDKIDVIYITVYK